MALIQKASYYFDLEDPSVPGQDLIREMNEDFREMGVPLRVSLVKEEMGYSLQFEKTDD